ncbi:MAG TPA: sigma-70 family RNA polymerase sigma factor [Vicinamibacterales bacterium]|nr:sigma-70 family RNA polymerase sigma factor [Vicinamibacterales bacterium]
MIRAVADAPLVRQPDRSDTPNQVAAKRAEARERWERIFLAELPTIQRLIACVARRHQLSPVDAEDFAGEVHLRLTCDDYAVLRKFRSGCKLRTFLTVVIQRLFLDYRNAQWGKWRPSAQSMREGPVAVQLERLTTRDGFTFDEACEILETNYRHCVDRIALARTYARFRPRARPRFVNDAVDADGAPATASADENLVVNDAQRVVERTAAVLRTLLRAASAQDRLILRLHFFESVSLADIARRLELDQKRLYRRLERLLKRLRAALEQQGISAADVLPAVSRHETRLEAVFPRDNVVAMRRGRH